MAVAYAARHPERVSQLVLCSAYARGRAVRAVGEDEKRAAALDLDLARVGWGRDDPAFRQVFAAQFLPDGTRADWAAFDQLQRRTTSPDNAVRFLQQFAQIDVRDEAGQVACPTLIMHSRDDHRVPMRYGEELAALIPDSRLVGLVSNNHLLTAAEPAWQVFRDEVEAFLACLGRPSISIQSPRILHVPGRADHAGHMRKHLRTLILGISAIIALGTLSAVPADRRRSDASSQPAPATSSTAQAFPASARYIADMRGPTARR